MCSLGRWFCATYGGAGIRSVSQVDRLSLKQIVYERRCGYIVVLCNEESLVRRNIWTGSDKIVVCS